MFNQKLLLPLLVFSFFLHPLRSPAAEPPLSDLTPSPTLKTIKQIKIREGLSYAKLSWKGSTVHCISVDPKSKNLKVFPYMSGKATEPSLSILDADAIFAVNGGFFNLSDGESTSFITADGKSMCNPKENKALIENPKLKPFLPQIFDRSEIRFYTTKKNKQYAEIVKHSQPTKNGYELEAALQGGPQLLPKLTSEEEAFVRKDAKGNSSDSIGTKSKAARTAIGITSDGKLKILCAEGGRKKEFVSGLSLKDMAELFQKLECTSALNLDGGTSTAMVVNLNNLFDEKLKSKMDKIGPAGLPQPAGSVPAGAPVPEGKIVEAPGGTRVIYSASPERRVKSLLCVAERFE